MLNAPPGHFWCGNVISDPYGHLVNVVGPAAAVCAAVLVARCVKARRCSCRAVAAVLTFAATSGFLVYEARFLADYGCDVGRPWWLPSWLPW